MAKIQPFQKDVTAPLKVAGYILFKVDCCSYRCIFFKDQEVVMSLYPFKLKNENAELQGFNQLFLHHLFLF